MPKPHVHEREKAVNENGLRQLEQSRLTPQVIFSAASLPLSRDQALALLVIITIANVANTVSAELDHQSSAVNENAPRDAISVLRKYQNDTSLFGAYAMSEYRFTIAVPPRESFKSKIKLLRELNSVELNEEIIQAIKTRNLDFFRTSLAKKIFTANRTVKSSDVESPLLIIAVREDWLELVLVLLRYKADPNSATLNGLTPLIAAIESSPRSIPVLVDANADIYVNFHGNTLLDLSMALLKEEAIHQIIDCSPNLNLLDKPLTTALNHENPLLFEYLCRYGLPIEKEEIELRWRQLKQEGNKVISYDVMISIMETYDVIYYREQQKSRKKYKPTDKIERYQLIRLIRGALKDDDWPFIMKLTSKIDPWIKLIPDIVKEREHTLWIWSLRFGAKTIAINLAKLADDLNKVDRYGMTPLAYAAESSSPTAPQLVEYLIQQGANVNSRNTNDGYTPLHIAAISNKKNVPELLRYAADIHARDNLGNTPLMLGVLRKPIQIDYLIKHGLTNVNCQDDNGQTPLMIATIQKNVVGMRVLLKAGADTNMVNQHGFGALHYAIVNNAEAAAIDLLIQYGTKLDKPDVYGYTLLRSAIQANNLDAVRKLLQHGAKYDREALMKWPELQFNHQTVTALLDEHERSKGRIKSWLIPFLMVVLALAYGVITFFKKKEIKPVTVELPVLPNHIEVLNAITDHAFITPWEKVGSKYELVCIHAVPSVKDEKEQFKKINDMIDRFLRDTELGKCIFADGKFSAEFSSEQHISFNTIKNKVRKLNNDIINLLTVNSLANQNAQIKEQIKEVNTTITKVKNAGEKVAQLIPEFNQSVISLKNKMIDDKLDQSQNRRIRKIREGLNHYLDDLKTDLDATKKYNEDYIKGLNVTLASFKDKINAGNNNTIKFVAQLQKKVAKFLHQLNNEITKIEVLNKRYAGRKEILRGLDTEYHSLRNKLKVSETHAPQEQFAPADESEVVELEQVSIQEEAASPELPAHEARKKSDKAVATLPVIIVPRREITPFETDLRYLQTVLVDIRYILNVVVDIDTQEILIHALLYNLIQFFKHIDVICAKDEPTKLRNLLAHPACRDSSVSLTQNIIYVVAVELDSTYTDNFNAAVKKYDPKHHEQFVNDIYLELKSSCGKNVDELCLNARYQSLQDSCERINKAARMLKKLGELKINANEFQANKLVYSAAKMYLGKIGEFWHDIVDYHLPEATQFKRSLVLYQWDLSDNTLLDKARLVRNRICHINLDGKEDTTAEELLLFLSRLPDGALLQHNNRLKLNTFSLFKEEPQRIVLPAASSTRLQSRNVLL